MSNDRYNRQVLFHGIGPEGQAKLRQAKVLVVGCGALGSGVINALGRAGVGYLRFIDPDAVELSNLHRQILFEQQDTVGALPKVAAAAEKMRRINPDVELDPIEGLLTEPLAVHLIPDVDLVIDGTDNFEVRNVINEVCLRYGTPWVYGGIVGSHGMVATLRPGKGPCFRCIFPHDAPPEKTPDRTSVGVIGPVVQMAASIQATEAIKLLVGAEDKIVPGYVRFNMWDWRFHVVSCERNPNCSACGDPAMEET